MGEAADDLGLDNMENATTSEADGEKVRRERARIEFPYADLDAAVELAETLHEKAGSAVCQVNQLAAWMNQSADGGTFRTRLSAGRLFGLIERQDGGRVFLTPLGRNILDKARAPGARAESFMRVPLFQAMYAQHQGHTLPPAAAIERQMVGLGVPTKQAERARQTFMKSAQVAGFIDASTGRFIMPSAAPTTPAAPDDAKAGAEASPVSGGSGDGPQDPLIGALIQKLPRSGRWPAADRVIWLRMAVMAFDMAYGRDSTIDVKEGQQP